MRVGVGLCAVLLLGCVGCGERETRSASVALPGMVWLPGGDFIMGADFGAPHEGPAHRVRLSPFQLDTHEVTNRQYHAFAVATGYETESEKLGWSGVFEPALGEWVSRPGADWRHPMGPDSSHEDVPEHPVVHLSWWDANAFCAWRDARLPTEAEFEFAVRSGRRGATYGWGEQLAPGGQHRANLWQGVFPTRNEKLDGFGGAAAVGRFPPNAYGVYDLTGNVWEWVHDWFAPHAENVKGGALRVNPRGPRNGTQKVQRGGSFLCSENFCQGYRVAARMMTAPNTGVNNLGFRCAAS